jgi:hypothetical protein
MVAHTAVPTQVEHTQPRWLRKCAVVQRCRWSYQTVINQRLDAHYEELIASEKEARPERLEKVRVKLCPDPDV